MFITGSNQCHKFGLHDRSLKLFYVSAYDLTEKGGSLPYFFFEESNKLEKQLFKDLTAILGSHNLEPFPFAQISFPLLSLISCRLTIFP